MPLTVDVSHEFSHFSLNVAFDTADAPVTALFGPSGSGKTTILCAIAGLLLPNHGTITLEGNVLLDSAQRTNVPPQKRRLGYV